MNNNESLDKNKVWSNFKKKKPSEIIIFILACVLVLTVLLRTVIFKEGNFIYDVFEDENASYIYVKLIKTVYILAFAYLLNFSVSAFLSLGDKSKSKRAKTFSYLIASILKYVIALGAILVILNAWGADTSSLVTGASALTVVLGLGCQSLISDIVAGLFMIFDEDIQVGDIVVINGSRGIVRQIGLRRTKIEDDWGNINIIKNSAISTMVNNSQTLSWVYVTIGIDYDESIERVEQLLKDNMTTIAQKIPQIKGLPKYLGVNELADSSVNLKVMAQCNEEDIYTVQRALNKELKLLFDANNVNIPFNQIVISNR